MDESLGAQYAVQIAVHTLRDRCKSLQQRIALLEEENVNLRITCTRNEEVEHSLSEMDKLREQVTELTEQKDQFQDKVRMVTSENQELWKKLGKLVNVNKNLGEQLSKINETVNQHAAPLHTTLIRSKTFTQDEPQTKILQKNLELNEKISLELENVSLKLTDSFSKQKQEFEKICSEIPELQHTEMVISEQFGFCFEEKVDDELYEEFKYMLEDLNMIKTEVLHQREVLQKNLKNVENLKAKGIPRCKRCEKKSKTDRSTSMEDFPKLGVDKSTETIILNKDDKSKAVNHKSTQENDKICPVCCRMFRRDADFSDFQQHVENHFLAEDGQYELL